jgi:hypothetical protein
MDSLYIYPGRGLDASCMCVARGLVQIKRHLHVRTQHLAMRRMRPALFQQSHARMRMWRQRGSQAMKDWYRSMDHAYVLTCSMCTSKSMKDD